MELAPLLCDWCRRQLGVWRPPDPADGIHLGELLPPVFCSPGCADEYDRMNRPPNYLKRKR